MKLLKPPSLSVVFLTLSLTGLCLGLLGFSPGDTPPSQQPFPEASDAGSLQYPYAPRDSLYLSTPGAALDSIETSPAPVGLSSLAEPVFQLPPTHRAYIRVLLQDGAEAWSVSANTGLVLLWSRTEDGGTGKEEFAKGSLQVKWSRRGFLVTDSRRTFVIASTSIRFIPANPVVPLQLNGKAYRGNLDIYADSSGSQCVNVLSMEDYLRGVVSLEMGRPRENGLEALKAQAVVARTYAFKSMLGSANRVFDIRASTQDQVYGGIMAEYSLGDSAVLKTRGRVLTHSDTLALCYYHSTCGGKTASRNEVWGGPVIPYLVSQPDTDEKGQPWCNASRHMQWEQSWSADSLASILRKNLDAAGVGSAPAFSSVTGFHVRDRFSDGRVNTLEVSTDKGEIDLHGDKIRVALKAGLGNSRILRSSRFDIDLEGGRIVAHGSGNGHGIGMCQMGALGRSAAGQDFQTILAAYYPGTVVMTVK